MVKEKFLWSRKMARTLFAMLFASSGPVAA